MTCLTNLIGVIREHIAGHLSDWTLWYGVLSITITLLSDKLGMFLFQPLFKVYHFDLNFK